MSTSINIHKYRLTFFQTEIHRSLFANSARDQFPLGFMGSQPDYALAFEAIRNGADPANGFKAPWEGPVGHHYWEYYLQRNKLAELSGDKAWKFIVPLRATLPVTITTQTPTDRIYAEGFIYPFGIAVAITLRSDSTRSLDATVDDATAVKRGSILTVCWRDGAAHTASLDEAIDECRKFMRAKAFGVDALHDRISEIFSIFTVVRGEGDDAMTIPAYGSDVHRALDAVTTWPPNWKAAKLPALDDHVRPEICGFDPEHHLVYARRRGRAVWFPALFASKEARRSATCYHRNLTFASLQTASLAEFAAVTAAKIDQGAWMTLPEMHRNCAKLAAGILGRIYGKTRETYQSKGLRYLIDQNDLVKPINTLRDQVMMVDLV